MSRPQSRDSFYSAVSDHGMADVDDVSEPTCAFRPAKRITNEIQQHCHIFFDEQLFLSALTLLGDLVTSGTSHPDYPQLPAIAPLPFHIELVSCLLVHPRWTTHANPCEHITLQARSITLLRNILATLGPVNANLSEAFSFEHTNNTRPTRRGRNFGRDDTASGSDEEKPEQMRGVIANEGRLRRCASDFWHAIGWAFNCSVKYPKRWQYWKVWLEYMLDVLTKDYDERANLDREAQEALPPGSDAKYKDKLIKESLLIQYLSEVRGKSSAVRRIAKAIFANGGSESLNEFTEIFKNETKELKIENGQKRKRADTNQDNNFGGYDDDVADEDLHSIESDMSENEEGDGPDGDAYLGGAESLMLRQRIFALLSQVSAEIPHEFVDIVDLYEAVYICMKPLSIPTFTLFLAPSRSSFIPPVAQISLTQLFLRRMISNDAPHPRTIRKGDFDELDQNILEKCFLPFPAATSSIDENAKVSVMIETLFRIILKDCHCIYTPEFELATEKGIKVREAMMKPKKGRKPTGAKHRVEAADKALLKASGIRLRSLVSILQH